MQSKITVDADDFFEKSNALHLFYQIKSKVPTFKITLFTIPALCTPNFLGLVKKLDWIDMCPHGWAHTTSRECENWTYEESRAYLHNIESLGLTKIFKAPGWQISDGMYQALLEEGYGVADQAYNNERRPKELPVYLLNEPNRYHYHIQDVCGNGIHEKFDELIGLKGNFEFIRDIIK